MNEGTEYYDPAMSGKASATSGGGSQTIGDNTYFADNSSTISFAGAQVDNSTNVGIQGSELNTILASVTSIASQSIGTMSETASQLAQSATQNGSNIFAQYKTPIIYAVGAGLLFFLAKQLKLI